MAYIRPLKERLRVGIDKLMKIYGIGEFSFDMRSLKAELREDIKKLLHQEGAADNTAIDIYLEDTTLIIRVGEFEYRWN